MLRRVRYIWAKALIIVCTVNASAQYSVSDTTLVTATRIEAAAKKTGTSVTVISQEEIKRSPANTVDELLRYQVGLNTNTRGAFGVQNDIGIRGSTFSQVLVLVDGIRLNDPLTGHFNQNIPVPLTEIASIEIVRGPATANFGADAVGGLIHIKTKTYLNRHAPGWSSTGELGAGQNGLLLGDASISHSDDKLQVSLGARYASADGETYRNPNFDAGISSIEEYSNFFDMQQYTGAVRYELSDRSSIYARLAYEQREFAAKYFYTRSAFDESTEETSSLWTQLAYNTVGDASVTDVQIGWKRSEDLFIFNPIFTPNEHTMQQYILTANQSRRISDKISLAYGLQAEYREIESSDRGDHSNVSSGAYLSSAWDVTDHTRINSTLRLQHDDNYGVSLVPQMSIAHQLDRLTLRAGFGSAVRAGDFTERYISSEIPMLVTGRNIGNPDLQEERSQSFELGADYGSENWSASITGFLRQSENLIDFTLTSSSDIFNQDNLQDGFYFYATNVSESSVKGIEFSWSGEMALGEKLALSPSLQYTYLETRTDLETLSKYIANHPSHQLILGLGLEVSAVRLQWMSRYQKRNPELGESVNAFIPENTWTHDLRITAELIEQLGVFVNVTNLSDARYQEIFGAQLPGRWFQGGIRWTL